MKTFLEIKDKNYIQHYVNLNKVLEIVYNRMSDTYTIILENGAMIDANKSKFEKNFNIKDFIL